MAALPKALGLLPLSQAGRAVGMVVDSACGGAACGGGGGGALPVLAVQLVRSLLRADPAQRLSADAVLAHPWIVASQSRRFSRPASSHRQKVRPLWPCES